MGTWKKKLILRREIIFEDLSYQPYIYGTSIYSLPEAKVSFFSYLLYKWFEWYDNRKLILLLQTAISLHIFIQFLYNFCRCQSFKVKRGEICKIPGCSVSPIPGSPTPVRLPHFQGETFRQFITYVYTGKVRAKDTIFCIRTMLFSLLLTCTPLEKKGSSRKRGGRSHKFWTFKHLW